MAGYTIRRVALSLVTVVLITAAVYAAARLLPGGPTWGEDPAATPHVQAWLERLGADEPILPAYVRWLSRVIRLDFGLSLGVSPGRDVGDLLLEALPCTLALGLLAFGLTLLLALPLGVLSAWRPDSAAARLGAAGLYTLHALPVFWIALVLQHLLAQRLGLFPALGTGPAGEAHRAVSLATLPYWVLPTVGLTLGSLAFVIRFCRSTLLESVRRDYVRAARARGAGDSRVLLRHALANTAVPMISLAGLMLPGVVSGSVMVETVFALPGLGRLFVMAAGRRDYPVIMAIALLTTVATLAANLLADLLYRIVDPRVPPGGAETGP